MTWHRGTDIDREIWAVMEFAPLAMFFGLMGGSENTNCCLNTGWTVESESEKPQLNKGRTLKCDWAASAMQIRLHCDMRSFNALNWCFLTLRLCNWLPTVATLETTDWLWTMTMEYMNTEYYKWLHQVAYYVCIAQDIQAHVATSLSSEQSRRCKLSIPSHAATFDSTLDPVPLVRGRACRSMSSSNLI